MYAIIHESKKLQYTLRNLMKESWSPKKILYQRVVGKNYKTQA